MPLTTKDQRLTTDSTIVAIATAPGLGASAIVRLSGPEAFAVAGCVAPSVEVARAREAQLVALVGPDGEAIDQALVTCFPAPHSFTGDDTVEFSAHGGALVPGLVVAAIVAAGARMAEPGEFTRRAVLNGKLDLLQAEAVGGPLSATPPGQATGGARPPACALSRRRAAAREGTVPAPAPVAAPTSDGTSAVQSIFDHMADRVANNPGMVQQVRASFQFELTGDNGGEWFVNLKEGAGVVSAGTIPDADCTIHMKPKIFTQADVGQPRQIIDRPGIDGARTANDADWAATGGAIRKYLERKGEVPARPLHPPPRRSVAPAP